MYVDGEEVISGEAIGIGLPYCFLGIGGYEYCYLIGYDSLNLGVSLIEIL